MLRKTASEMFQIFKEMNASMRPQRNAAENVEFINGYPDD